MQYMRFQSPKVRKKFAGASIVFTTMYKKKKRRSLDWIFY